MVANLAWFICNIALYFAARNVQAPVDTFLEWDLIYIY